MRKRSKLSQTERSLRKLIKEGRTEELLNLIEQKTSFNDSTLLSLAAKAGNLAVLAALVDKGASLSLPDNKGQFVLHTAAKEGQVEVIQYLLKNGINVNQQNQSGATALFIAVKNSHHSVVEILLQKGADVECESSTLYNKEKPIHAAAVLKDSKVLDLILRTSADIDALNDDNRTALHLAALKGCSWNVDLLIGRFAKLNLQDVNMNSPLHLAAEQGNQEAVRLLCIAGANFYLQNSSLAHALRLAVDNFHLSVVRTLLHFGVDVNRPDSSEEPILRNALKSCRFAMNNDWCSKSNKGSRRVAVNQEIKMIDALISGGLDLSLKDYHSDPLIAICASCSCAAVLTYLLQSGVDCTQLTLVGESALVVAAKLNITTAATILIKQCPVLINHISDSQVPPSPQVTFRLFSTFRYARTCLSPPIWLWLHGNKGVVVLLCEAGYRFSRQERDFIELNTVPRIRNSAKRVDTVIRKYLLDQFSNPWTLARCARTAVRQCLRTGLEFKVDKLDIPLILRNQLLLK